MVDVTWGTATAALAAPFVFLLPGAALLGLLAPPESFQPEQRPDIVSWMALAAGLTLALVPLGLLGLHLMGIAVGAEVILSALAVSAGVILWRRLPAWRHWANHTGSRAWPDGPILALIPISALIVGVRLWVVRGIDIGFWGDSYQHTLITQLILDNGGLFESWLPYAPLTTLTYHFGFHSNVAFFQWASSWITGNPTPRTVVLVGQFLNAGAALALYPLAVRLSGGRRWIGVLTVLLAGLLTPMPMYYVNWGRYTQLAGQTILPAAAWLLMEAVESPRRRSGRLALAVLAAAGLALTHYFVLAFYVLFVVAYLAARLLADKCRQARWRETLLRTAVVAGMSVLLVLPWAMVIMEGKLPQILVGTVQGAPPEEQIQAETIFHPLGDFLPLYLAGAAGLGGLWALARRRQTALLLPWAGLQLLVANPYWLGLPGAGVISNFTVELALYIPASTLAASLAVSLWEAVRRRVRLPSAAVAAVGALLLGLAALLGTREQAGVLAYEYQLVTPADEAAMTWVRAHTPTESRFLINSFFAYGGSLIAGSDAGWWLPLLARRQNTVPPLNYGSEAGPVPDYRERINAVTARLETADLGDRSTVEYLQAEGITHVFIGEKGGPLLDTRRLQDSPSYRAVYTPAPGLPGPWVFEVAVP